MNSQFPFWTLSLFCCNSILTYFPSIIFCDLHYHVVFQSLAYVFFKAKQFLVSWHIETYFCCLIWTRFRVKHILFVYRGRIISCNSVYSIVSHGFLALLFCFWVLLYYMLDIFHDNEYFIIYYIYMMMLFFTILHYSSILNSQIVGKDIHSSYQATWSPYVLLYVLGQLKIKCLEGW